MLSGFLGLCQNEDVTCDPPWKKVWHGCYLFLKDTFRTWSDARANCTAQGGDLFVINDAKEMVILNLIFTITYDYSNNNNNNKNESIN